MTTQKKVRGRFGSAAASMLLVTAGTALARLYARQLELRERSIRRQSLAHQQRIHWELLVRAIDDPSLAEVIDTYDENIPAARRRQFFYANAWYVNLFHLYRAGLIDQEEFYKHAREIFQNPLMREYWDASQRQRATLKQSSDEARLGRLVDDLIHDLEDADTDEWWVVGHPPGSE
ncbi:DUF6082 family protein [Streptomyces sp. NPDC032940]|uniref:DUF6082 family protein n=1 Tax=Streptomyces sp. NPDC032940 TaxID=3155366 RepID=UPI0033E9D37D